MMVKNENLIFDYLEEFNFHGGCPARRWLVRNYLPSLDGTILFIGLNDYNAINCEIVKDPSKYYTIDLFEDRSKVGGNHLYPENNFIGNFKGHKNTYDHICLFGCHGNVGRGVDNENVVNDLEYSHYLLKDNGTLLWGPTDYIDVNLVGKDNSLLIDEPVSFRDFVDIILNHPNLPFSKYEILKSEKWENIIWWGRKI